MFNHAAAETLAPTIFHQPWWLDIASSGSYQEATVLCDGQVVGRLPYLKCRSNLGFVVLCMPALSHVLGPAVAPQYEGHNFPRSLKQMTILQELIAGLPRAAHASFRLHGGLNNTLAFQAAGFTTDVRFTIEIPPALPAELWRQMRDKTRNAIRRAQEVLTVSEVCTPEEFFNFYEQNLKGKGMRNSYKRVVAQALMVECLRRGCGRVLVARNAAGGLMAAIFTVWDVSTEFYFMSTRSLDAHNGAVNLLLWHGIQHAAANDLTFDMDLFHVVGRGVPNLLLLTGFGGRMVPRYQVHRSWPLVRLGRSLRG